MFPQQPELSVPTVAGLLLVTLVANLACVLLVAALLDRYVGEPAGSPGTGGDAATADADPVPPVGAPDGRTVQCSECGAENDPGYRYCRACVARLPGRASADGDVVPRFGRFAD